ncbi:MAG: hypothetical protein DWQ37_12350 [Planctomycetota bacterium]|nr:MAG: hypothetical protein DWQ37_12350 [Planctomycetota bacterium]
MAAVVVTRADASAQAELDERLEELRRQGAPLSLEDLARKPPRPEDNAATYIRRAKESVDSISKEVDAAYENEPERDQRAIDFGRPTEAYLRAVRSAFEAYPATLPLLEQAANCQAYDAQYDYRASTSDFLDELLKQSQLNRAAIRVLGYRAAQQTADGQHDDALETGIVMLKLCHLLDNEPTLVGSLVAFACRAVALYTIDLTLRSGDVSEKLRDALDKELARSQVEQTFLNSLESDRAFGLTVLQEVAAGKHRPTDSFNVFWRTASDFQKDQSRYLDYVALCSSLTNKPYADIKHNDALVKASEPLAEEIADAPQGAQVSRCRAQVYERAIRILNAIQRYEKTHPGQVPTVAELGLHKEVTTDPFNAQPLHIEKKPGGWLIYSVDMNLKDDGGPTTWSDIGFGPLPRTRED